MTKLLIIAFLALSYFTITESGNSFNVTGSNGYYGSGWKSGNSFYYYDSTGTTYSGYTSGRHTTVNVYRRSETTYKPLYDYKPLFKREDTFKLFPE